MRNDVPFRSTSVLSLLVSLVMVLTVETTFGQSSTRSGAPVGSGTRAGSGTRTGAVGLEGYCPVCVVNMKKWVKGSSNHQVAFDGRTYFFPGKEQRDMFLKNPAKYAPAFRGDCTVCFAKMGKHIPGNVRYSVLHRGRLFLFPGQDQKQEFFSKPTQYENVDLALNGRCAVCQVEMGQSVPGRPEFTVVHEGMRYQFPGAEQRDVFLKNPLKYSVKMSVRQSSVRHDEFQMVNVRGRSGCAGCDHGVVPVGDPSELGLAVNAGDGKVFVIEGAHKRYPRIYEQRFEKLQLAVAGKVIKQQGKFAWIEPSRLKIVN